MSVGTVVGLAACADAAPVTETPDDTEPAPIAALAVSPCEPPNTDFGTVSASSYTRKTLTLRNTGDVAVTLGGVAVGPPFYIAAPEALTIEPAGAYELVLAFDPMEYAPHVSDFSFAWSAEGVAQEPIVCTARGQLDADEDDDGHDTVDAGGDDCDDDDSGAHPGAAEIWYDGRDEDCAGGSDFDADSDGYESGVFNDDPEDGGGDCDDLDPIVHPAAADPYDGVDQDCNDRDGP